MRLFRAIDIVFRVIRVSQCNSVLLFISATVDIHIVSVHPVDDVIFRRTDITVRYKQQVMLSVYLNFCVITLTMN